MPLKDGLTFHDLIGLPEAAAIISQYGVLHLVSIMPQGLGCVIRIDELGAIVDVPRLVHHLDDKGLVPAHGKLRKAVNSALAISEQLREERAQLAETLERTQKDLQRAIERITELEQQGAPVLESLHEGQLDGLRAYDPAVELDGPPLPPEAYMELEPASELPAIRRPRTPSKEDFTVLAPAAEPETQSHYPKGLEGLEHCPQCRTLTKVRELGQHLFDAHQAHNLDCPYCERWWAAPKGIRMFGLHVEACAKAHAAKVA